MLFVSLKNNLKIFIFCLIFAGLGYFLGKQNQNNSSVFSEIRSNKENYLFINPLLECDSSSFSSNITFDSLKDKLLSQINKLKNTGQISSVSIYLRDLNNGPWLGINEKDNFSPASLIKVPLMITYYKEAETNPDILKQNLEYLPIKDELNQNILPSVTLIPTQSYTIEDLIYNMIVYSDNQAYDLLLNNIDHQILIDTYSNLGVDISKGFSDPSGNILSVKSYAAFFRILYNASYLSPEMSEKALSLLSKVHYQDALVKGINNPSVKISHKFGERTFIDTGEKQLHDCGIVYLPQKPHLICIMTRGNDFAKLSETIAQISQTIYQHISQKP